MRRLGVCAALLWLAAAALADDAPPAEAAAVEVEGSDAPAAEAEEPARASLNTLGGEVLSALGPEPVADETAGETAAAEEGGVEVAATEEEEEEEEAEAEAPPPPPKPPAIANLRTTEPVVGRPRDPPQDLGLEPASLAELQALLAAGQRDASTAAAAVAAAEAGRAADWDALGDEERKAAVTEALRAKRLAARGHYAVLGVRRSAPAAEIAHKFRSRAALAALAPDSGAALKILEAAHEALGDGASRAAYDALLVRRADARRARFKREAIALARTAWAFIAERSADFPRVFYGSALAAFALV